ncbi:MAG TPA: HupE/UreJ family protein [Polyangia bacterium]|nr:HupE/UreJ family protein [Polyangia bacterium]
MKARTAALVLCATTLVAVPAARAHQQTTSFAEIAYPVDGGDLVWRIRFRVADVVRIAPGGNAAAVIAAGLRVSATRGETALPCPRSGLSLQPDPSAPEPSSVLVARFACGPGARALHLRYDVLFDRDPYHASYARLAVGEAAASDDASTVVFYDRQREVTLDVRQPEPLWRTALVYLRLGAAHILTGADHLAFLAALLLAAAVRGRRPARPASNRQAVAATLGIVSAFTVAHSTTLAAQVLHPGLVPTRWVEPAIAFSVAFVALENLLPRPPRGRWALVFGFGLVHGLGFASALREIGLPRRGLVLSLVAFNLGVELGQLLVVALALPILVAAARRDAERYERWALRALSSGIALVGLVWLVVRIARPH